MVLFMVIARTFWNFVEAVVRGAVGGNTGPSPQGGRRASGPPAAVKMQQCPVCGTYVVPGKAISVVSGGQPVYFDSEQCRAEFQSR